MDIFRECLETMKKKFVPDPEQWDVQLKEGEEPVPEECNDTTLGLKTKEGFIINIVFEYPHKSFGVFVKLPDGFNHDAINISGIGMEPSTLQFLCTDQEYYWHYHSVTHSDFSRPWKVQQEDYYVFGLGPVKILNTCRLFIKELMNKRHRGPNDTFQKNLCWMKEQCVIQDKKYWDLQLTNGEIPIALPFMHRLLSIQTQEGFRVQVDFVDFIPNCLSGHIELPSHLFFTLWVIEKSKFPTLNSYVSNLNVEVIHWQDNHFKWFYDDSSYAKMTLPLASQPDEHTSDGYKCVIGPVQVMDEARRIIQAVMTVESEILAGLKREMMDILREELMMKACHPKRIAKWVEQEFDPFSG